MQTHPYTDWTSALEHEARMLLEDLDANPVAQRLFDGTIDTKDYAGWLV